MQNGHTGMKRGDFKMLKRKFKKYVADCTLESGFDLQIWLKEPYIFSGSDAGCTFFNLDDYETMAEVWAAANQCCEDEITKAD